MWILLAIVLEMSSPDITIPVLDSPLVHNSLEECEASMNDIYKKYKKLEANYPVEIEYKIDDSKHKYMLYSYKSDYTKPKTLKYYYCLKSDNK